MKLHFSVSNLLLVSSFSQQGAATSRPEEELDRLTKKLVYDMNHPPADDYFGTAGSISCGFVKNSIRFLTFSTRVLRPLRSLRGQRGRRRQRLHRDGAGVPRGVFHVHHVPRTPPRAAVLRSGQEELL